MQAIIDIYRMNEISVPTRVSIIKKLGHAINNQFGNNITEPLVYELVLSLDPNNEIRNNTQYTIYLS
jgi:hypothetical protein